MKSAWVDSDAKAALDHWAKTGIGPDLALRILFDPLAWRRAKVGPARRWQHFGEDASQRPSWRGCRCPLRQRLQLGSWPSIEPAGMPAVRLAALELASRSAMSCKTVAPSLQASAVAPDGIIEAIESPAHRFLLAIQWHPEFLFERHAVHRRLFEALLHAARRGACMSSLDRSNNHNQVVPVVFCYTLTSDGALAH